LIIFIILWSTPLGGPSRLVEPSIIVVIRVNHDRVDPLLLVCSLGKVFGCQYSFFIFLVLFLVYSSFQWHSFDNWRWCSVRMCVQFLNDKQDASAPLHISQGC
jgi:hypothetical protein